MVVLVREDDIEDEREVVQDEEDAEEDDEGERKEASDMSGGLAIKRGDGEERRAKKAE